MFYEGGNTLKDTHNVFWRETVNHITLFVYMKFPRGTFNLSKLFASCLRNNSKDTIIISILVSKKKSQKQEWID